MDIVALQQAIALGKKIFSRRPTGEKVIYVSRGALASDSNDGLAWGSAFATLAGARTFLTANPTWVGRIQLGWGTFGTNGFVLPNGCELLGIGRAGTFVTLNAGQNANVIQDANWGSATAVSDQVSIRDMTVNGNKASQTLVPARTLSTVTATLSGSTATLYVQDVSQWVAASISSGNLWIGGTLCSFTGVTSMGAFDPNNPTTTGGKFTGVATLTGGTVTFYPEAYVRAGAQWGAGIALQASRVVLKNLLVMSCIGDGVTMQGAGQSGSIAYENLIDNLRDQQCNGWGVSIFPGATDGKMRDHVSGNAGIGAQLIAAEDWQIRGSHPGGVFPANFAGGGVYNARNMQFQVVICASITRIYGCHFDIPSYGMVQINLAWFQQPVYGVTVEGDTYGVSTAGSGCANAVGLYGQQDTGFLDVRDLTLKLSIRGRALHAIATQPTSEVALVSGTVTTPASGGTAIKLQVLNAQSFSPLGGAIAGYLQITSSAGSNQDVITYTGRQSSSAWTNLAAAIGDTTLTLEDLQSFDSGGGTVIVYPQSASEAGVAGYRVTYTGIDVPNKRLTGIPASSTGSIPAALPIGTGVTQHFLTGVTSTGAGGVAIADAATVWQSITAPRGGRQVAAVNGRADLDTAFNLRGGSIVYPATGSLLKLRTEGRIVENPNPMRAVVTITAGQTQAGVTHSLFTKPTWYKVTPIDGSPGAICWASADATNVYANIASVQGAGVKFLVEAAISPV